MDTRRLNHGENILKNFLLSNRKILCGASHNGHRHLFSRMV